MSIIETRAINPDYSSSKETPPLVGREKYPITRRMGVKAKDEKERENLKNNRYLLASILRQQKVLDFLKNL